MTDDQAPVCGREDALASSHWQRTDLTVRAPKSFNDNIPPDYPLTSVRISNGARVKLKRTKRGRSSVTAWPAKTGDGRDLIMLQFKTGKLTKHVMISLEAVAAVAQLAERLANPISYIGTFTVRLTPKDSSADESRTEQVSPPIREDKPHG